MKKILSVLMASALLSIPTVSAASADDSNCKIKDILSNISQYTCFADFDFESSDCNFLNILGGLRDKLYDRENCGSCEEQEKQNLSDKIVDIIFGKFASDENQNISTQKPGDTQDEAPQESVQQDNTQKPSSDLALQVTELVNYYRAQNGLSALEYDADAACAAQKRAVEIQSVFSHTRPDGSRCFTALDECGASYRGAGENIAMGQTSAEQVMNEWMNSQGHRENILNPNFTKIGVGVAKGADGRYYWTQMFIY